MTVKIITRHDFTNATVRRRRIFKASSKSVLYLPVSQLIVYVTKQIAKSGSYIMKF